MFKVRGNPSLEPEEFRGFDGPQNQQRAAARESCCGLQLILFLEVVFLLANTGWLVYLQYKRIINDPWMIAATALSGIFVLLVGYLWWRIRVRDNYNSRLEEFEQDDADHISWTEYLILREYAFVRILAPLALLAVGLTLYLHTSNTNTNTASTNNTSNNNEQLEGWWGVPLWLLLVGCTHGRLRVLVLTDEADRFVRQKLL